MYSCIQDLCPEGWSINTGWGHIRWGRESRKGLPCIFLPSGEKDTVILWHWNIASRSTTTNTDGQPESLSEQSYLMEWWIFKITLILKCYHIGLCTKVSYLSIINNNDHCLCFGRQNREVDSLKTDHHILILWTPVLTGYWQEKMTACWAFCLAAFSPGVRKEASLL